MDKLKTLRDEVRRPLREHIKYEEGQLLRNKLHDFAVRDYKPMHNAEEYIEFLKSEISGCNFNINHPQSQNHPYYLTFFSQGSQHVMGDCLEECLDEAMKVIGA